MKILQTSNFMVIFVGKSLSLLSSEVAKLITVILVYVCLCVCACVYVSVRC